MLLPRPVDCLIIPEDIRHAIERWVTREYPVEAGGYLACRRQGGTLVALGHVPVANDAAEPTRRFETTVDERAPGVPRVFYHTHTSPSSPAGLTAIDRRNIPERYALVLFAPDGGVYSYRAFKRGLLRWREFPVHGRDTGDGATATYPLPRLPGQHLP